MESDIVFTKDSTIYTTKIDDKHFQVILNYENEVSTDKTLNVKLRQMGIDNEYSDEYPGYFTLEIPIEYDTEELHKEIAKMISDQYNSAFDFFLELE